MNAGRLDRHVQSESSLHIVPVPFMPRSRLALAVLAAASLWAGAAGAFEIEHSETRYAEPPLPVRSERQARCAARQGRGRAARLREISRRSTRASWRRASSSVRRRTWRCWRRSCACASGWFCRNVSRVERVEESQHALAATADPSRSDVKFGETRLQLSPGEHGGTLVHYRTSITPGFWIPAVVGRRWMLRTLEDASSDLFMNVEMKAREEQKAASN